MLNNSLLNQTINLQWFNLFGKIEIKFTKVKPSFPCKRESHDNLYEIPTFVGMTSLPFFCL